ERAVLAIAMLHFENMKAVAEHIQLKSDWKRLRLKRPQLPASASPGRLGRGTDDPAPERGEIALLGAEAAIDQVPAHALRDTQRKRRDQPAGGEVVVDIGADAHGDAEAVDRGLQRLAVELELEAARSQACDAGGLQPGRPIIG